MQPNDPKQHVFRDLIEEHRDDYSVTYQPADARASIAVLSLFFPNAPKDVSIVSRAMEKEMEAWLKRFPVPIKVAAFDSRKRTIRISPNASERQLMGYVRPFDDAIIRRWGVIEEGEIPAEVIEPEHLAAAYSSISYRVLEEEKAMARRELRAKVKSISWVIFLVLIFPLSTQAVLRYGQELALPLMLATALFGAYKGTAVMGWRKLTRREQRKAEEAFRRDHYYYHCEKNPTGFARLEKENLKREMSRENKEAKRLLQNVAARRTSQRPRWIFIPRLFRARTT